MDTKKIIMPVISEHRSKEHRLHRISDVGYKKEDQQRHAFIKEREQKQRLTLRLSPDLCREVIEIAFKTQDTVSNIGFRALTEYIKTLKK